MKLSSAPPSPSSRHSGTMHAAAAAVAVLLVPVALVLVTSKLREGMPTCFDECAAGGGTCGQAVGEAGGKLKTDAQHQRHSNSRTHCRTDETLG